MRIGWTASLVLAVGCHGEADPLETGDVPDAVDVFPATEVTVTAALPAVSTSGAIIGILGLGDLDGDGKAEVSAQLADRVEVWRGSDLVAGTAGEPWLTLVGATGIASAGDIDDDGKSDVLAGDGEAWRFYRGADLDAGTVAAGDAYATFTPGEGRQLRGLSGGEDVDGDGVGDVVGSQYLPNDNGRAREEVYVWSGASLRAGGTFVLDEGSAGYGAVVDDDGSGPASVTLFGDVDGDGLSELASGAVRNFAAVHLGDSVGGSTGMSNQEVHLHTCHPDEDCPNGTTVGAAGDVDGDGLADLLVSAFPTGTSYVIPGSALAADVYHTKLIGGTLATERAIAGARALVGVGDVQGTGYSAVAASDGSVMYLLLGNQLAGESAFDVNDALHRFVGFAPAGDLVIGAPGDVDGDGKPDFAAADRAGTLHVVLSPTP